MIYKKLGAKFTTPTIGTMFYAEDYIRFLENFDYYIRQPLKFKKYSKQPELKHITYPVGELGDDVEVLFPHEKTEAEASAKWVKRVKRINFKNLYIIYSDRDKFQEEYYDRFQKLSFEKKVFLSSKPRNEPNVVFVQDYENSPAVGASLNREFEKYFDVIKWLNNEKHFLRKSKRDKIKAKLNRN